MASKNDLNTCDFELLYENEQGITFATKKNDYGGPKYIAKPLDVPKGSGPDDTNEVEKLERGDDHAAFHNLLYNLNQGPAIAQIFNHESIISIAGYVKADPVGTVSAAQGPQASHPTNYIVWDFCDAGDLDTLLKSTYFWPPQFRMPESLCWHVLLSLLSAITYLHDGKRLFWNPKAPPGEERQWLSVDQDWNPILHRAIIRENIFFQRPRVVTNHVITPGNGPDIVGGEVEVSRATAPRRKDECPAWFRADTRPYTVVEELCSIGSIVFTMMRSRRIFDTFGERTTEYSWRLRQVIKDLTLLTYTCKNKTIPKVLPWTKRAMEDYRYWKNETDEGRQYKDLEDDMIQRCEHEAEMGKRQYGDGDMED